MYVPCTFNPAAHQTNLTSPQQPQDELGILDNGTLVGLNQSEMSSSLHTLGQMLQGLGGGEIRVGRVVQVSGDRLVAPNDLFPSFHVTSEEHEDLPLLKTTTGVEPITITKKQHQSQNLEKSAEEKAELKRVKRDARRVRRESEGETLRYQKRLALAPAATGPGENKVLVVTGAVRTARIGANKMSKSAPVKSTVMTECSNKPKLAKDGEVRFVVEAIVLRKKKDEDEEDEGEGWRYLDFDFMAAATRRRQGSA